MKLMVHLRIKTGNRPIKTTLCLIWYTCFMCRLKTCNMLINEFSPYFCSFCSIIFRGGTHFHPREVVGISFLLYLCIYSFVFQSRSCSTFSVFGLRDQTASIWRWLYSAVSCFRCITCILFSFVGVRALIVAHEMKRPHPPSLCVWGGRERQLGPAAAGPAQPGTAQPGLDQPSLRCQPNPVNHSSRSDKVNEPLCSLTHESIHIITQRKLKLRVNEWFVCSVVEVLRQIFK